MKKIFLVALAAIGMTACMQDEVVEIANGGAITFDNAFVGNVTRAESVTTGNLETFNVWGKVYEDPDNLSGNYGVVFDGTEVSDKDKDGVWTYNGIQYWMPWKRYTFAAISPASAVQGDLNESESIKFTTNGTIDLIYDEVEVMFDPDRTSTTVAFQFEHLLSKVKLSFDIDEALCEGNNTVSIENLQLNTTIEADYDLAGNAWDTSAAIKDTWFIDESVDYFIIPDECFIQFAVVIKVDNVEVYRQVKFATIPADAFEMGHAYDLRAEINPNTLALDEIVFSAEVEEWVEVTNPANTYNPAANLLYAAQIGGTYTLTEDVALETPVVVTGVDFVLNLNGHNVCADKAWTDEADGSSNAYAFWVKEGGKLTINGTGDVITTDCDYSMAIWANGGKVIVNGGNYYNTGNGSDLIYASGAGSEVEIYGGYFHACEKQDGEDGTMEKHSALNLKNNGKLGEKITVYGGTFYKFNPADNLSENPKQSFVAEGYTVTEDNDLYTVKYDAVETVAEFKSKIANGETNIMLAGNAVIDITDEVVYLTNATNISAPADSKATLKGKFVAESGQITFANIKFAPNAQFSTTLPGTYGTYVNGNYAAIVTVHKTAANFENCEFDGGDEYAVSITYFDEEPGLVMNVNNCKFTQTYIYSKVLCNLTNNTFILNACPYAMCVWPNIKGTTNGKCHFVNNTVSSNYYSADGKGHSLVQLLTQSTPYANTEFNVQGNTTDATKYIYGWVAAVTCATDGTVTFAEGSSRFDINQTSGKPE